MPLLFVLIDFFERFSSSFASWEQVYVSKSFLFTPNKVAILSNVCKSGWEVFVHHFETVQVFLPSFSASHFPVFFFSTRTSLILLRSSMSKGILISTQIYYIIFIIQKLFRLFLELRPKTLRNWTLK